jgi:hypothetical protein
MEKTGMRHHQSRYTGMVCAKHPELGGLRYTANGTCVQCNRDKSKQVKLSKKDKIGTRFFGKICAKHPELNGERLTCNSTCVYCHRDRSAVRQKKNGHPVMRRIRDKLINAVFDHYGRACTLCSENDPDVLTIDHTDQNGSDHKNSNGYRYKGIHLYRWLVNNNFPDGFRTLCFNCNIKQYKLHCRQVKEKLNGL